MRPATGRKWHVSPLHDASSEGCPSIGGHGGLGKAGWRLQDAHTQDAVARLYSLGAE